MIKKLEWRQTVTQTPVLLAQIKTGNNSYKLKNKICCNTYCIICVSTIKSEWMRIKAKNKTEQFFVHI